MSVRGCWMNLICCGRNVRNLEVWFLKDIKDFQARKLFFANCPFCGNPVVALYEKRISDNEVFFNKNIKGLNAVKTLYREKSRIVSKFYDVNADVLFGWVYGVNKEIKNKQGDVTQIRQYAKNFYGQKQKIKTLCCK